MTSNPVGIAPAPAVQPAERIDWWSGLQRRMMLSYIGITLLLVLLLELLITASVYLILTRSPLLDMILSYGAHGTAQIYALRAAVQAGSSGLDPRSTFVPGQPASLALPNDGSPQVPILSGQVNFIAPGSTLPDFAPFALLIAPNGQVLASSYPSRYPASASFAQLFPAQNPLVQAALAGKPGSNVEHTSGDIVAFAAQTIWNKENRPLGAIYVQIPLSFSSEGVLSELLQAWIRSATLWLLLMLPIGALFGILTTRGPVRRIRHLARATSDFAGGDYSRRVPVSGTDEVGLLERDFNQMANQLVESMAQQQVLVEQNARQAERARIEQELRTAQYIQLALLPKEVPPLPGWQLTPFYQPARTVGGDFYDLVLLEDGRLGIAIGDVTGKGVPAALVMATTCTMLRAAVQGEAAPGKVLARVNELLLAHIPSGMFTTCFFAVLDPARATLRYANAGHDLPYRKGSGAVQELRARGMPLGLMPDMEYEEQEVRLGPNDCVLFYTDGLVEAHNPAREMFGFPRLNHLLQEYSDGASLIDFLLKELKQFTGEGWDQEDDLTLMILRGTPNGHARN